MSAILKILVGIIALAVLAFGSVILYVVNKGGDPKDASKFEQKVLANKTASLVTGIALMILGLLLIVYVGASKDYSHESYVKESNGSAMMAMCGDSHFDDW